MKYKEPRIICEECSNEVPFTEEDLHGYVDEDEYEIFVTCPFCEEEIEVDNLEEYGYLPEDIVGGQYVELEQDTEI